MHPCITQHLARQHQESLAREAAGEQRSRRVHEQTQLLSRPSVVFQQQSMSEPDFTAIRRDLRSTLSEWCLETGTASSEAAIDTFMRRLRSRLGYSEHCTETRAIR